MSALNYIATRGSTDENIFSITRAYTEFLISEHNDYEYKKAIAKLFHSEEKRLTISLEKVRNRMEERFAKGLLDEPAIYLESLNLALKDVAKQIAEEKNFRYDEDDFFFIGLTGSFGDHHVTPRTLKAYFLGQTVCLEGIISRCTISRPKVSRSVHYCEATKLFLYKDYRDATNANSENPITSFTYPVEDENGNPLITEFGMSIYRDHQTVTVQEMPERAPPGQLPRSVDVLLDDDLVDKVKPGDRIRISGVYKSLGNRNVSHTSGTFKTILIANHIRHIGSKSSTSTDVIPSVITINEQDKKNIIKLKNERKNKKDKNRLVDLLASSLMPSIYGHEYIKKAILLMLLGGNEKNLENGTHIRGDINIMLVGDPSTAKSQVLRYVLNMANLAVATTGRGSSGVGLTAAVTTDPDSGERRLEAGAMVLADRGVVCIDEFDKMSDIDRVAIHEVMEQQTVTISKAGIHTTLNARCSVLAAANPVYGQYDETKDPHRNISLPDSLLSRFDLLFVVLDKADEELDRSIAYHVLKMHQFIPQGVDHGEVIRQDSALLLAFQDLNIEDESESLDSKATPVYETNHSSKNAGLLKSDKPNAKRELLTSAFIKNFIYYAKSEYKPVLTADAVEKIKDRYTELRNDKDPNNQRKTLPVTARSLETIIRLATAHAKARLSKEVEVNDVESAYELLRFALFKEKAKKKKNEKKKRVRTNNGQSVPADGNAIEEDDEEDNVGEEYEEVSSEEEIDEEEDEMDDGAEETNEAELTQEDISEIELSEEFMGILGETALLLKDRDGNEDQIHMSLLIQELKNQGYTNISRAKVIAGLQRMNEQNEIMFRDETIFFL